MKKKMVIMKIESVADICQLMADQIYLQGNRLETEIADMLIDITEKIRDEKQEVLEGEHG